MYDPERGRRRTPVDRNAKPPKEVTWAEFAAFVKQHFGQLKAASDKAIAILQDEVNRGALNPKLWKLFLDRQLYNLFADQTGFVLRPSAPQVPT